MNNPSFNINVLNFRITLELGTHEISEQRVRYNIWDLLADVGGFNDGLLLLCSIFMSSYSAFSFTLDVLGQFPVDVSKSSQG